MITCEFQEQTRQHALTIVAMEERLLKLVKQNKQLEQEAIYSKQHSGNLTGRQTEKHFMLKGYWKALKMARSMFILF